VIDFAPNDEHSMLQESLRRLFAEHSTSDQVRASEDSEAGWSPELWSLLGQSGLLGIGIAEEAGGAGGGPLHAALFAQETGRALAPIPVLESAFAATLLAGAGGDIGRRWLERLVAGEAVLVAIDARVEVDSGPRVSGGARFVPYGTAASAFLVRGADDEGLIVPVGEGVRVRRQPVLGPAPAAEVQLEAAPAQRMGPLSPEVFAAAEAAVQLAAIAGAAGGIGGVLDYAVAYACERRQFGRPIGSFQAIQHRLADVALDHERARLLALRSASELTAGLDARRALDAGLLVALDGYRRAAASACQVLGGYGFMLEYDTQLHLRAAKTLRLALPADAPARRLGRAALAHSA
jgi:alkylation response protein AidB-like acyl-CoA dehydrogenase